MSDKLQGLQAGWDLLREWEKEVLSPPPSAPRRRQRARPPQSPQDQFNAGVEAAALKAVGGMFQNELDALTRETKEIDVTEG